jgi:endo-1,4-beta-xylanase
MLTRRDVLAGLAALPTIGMAQAQEPGLADLAASHGRFFGSALTSHDLAPDDAYFQLLASQCDVFVTSWQLKWGALASSLDAEADFAPVDAILDTARGLSKKLRGHTLIWHEHAPEGLDALTNAADWDRHVLPHFQRVLGRYRNDFFHWDVVNEAINPPDGQADFMRDTPFLRMRGPDYVAEAFRLAHELAPEAKLYLNDYNICYADSWQNERRTGILRLLERLVGAGVPIHGLGLQAHLDTRFTFGEKVLSDFLDEVTAMGLEMTLTELDVREADETHGLDLTGRQQRAADEVRKVLSVALDYKAMTGVTVWGLADHHSWLRSSRNLPDNQGLPYDDQLNPTPMRAALADLFSRSPSRG